MSLVNALLGAIQDPNAQASPNQLGGILNTVQQLSQTTQANPDAMQTAMGIVGKYVRSGLQETKNTQGAAAAQDLVNQYSGTQPNAQVVNLLLNQEQVQNLISEVAQKTGLPAATIQGLLPSLIPLVLQFLQSGTPTDGGANNAVLNSFLDTDGDGDVDLADAMKMASRYL
ncbi:DUF937 domain-containing protein [Spirulina major]|uniref:DUF937 domain-containing protein n=1 Tax=Spirulina major TaxID=270636 RepID=UPI000933EBE6|nr:DUF937 domain-containing protein [Spirulina major]